MLTERSPRLLFLSGECAVLITFGGWFIVLLVAATIVSLCALFIANRLGFRPFGDLTIREMLNVQRNGPHPKRSYASA